MKWFRKDFIPKDLLTKYICKKKMKLALKKTCNTDKSNIFACAIKCKTRGIHLACEDQGKILAYRELYGSESFTQVVFRFM